MEGDIKECFDEGVDAAISKLIELKKIREILEEWAPKKRTIDFDIIDTAIEDSKDKTGIDHRTNAIDLKVLEQSVGTNIVVHQQLLTAFIGELPMEINELRNTVLCRNHQQLSDAAHKLKSSSRSMGTIILAISVINLNFLGVTLIGQR